MNTDLLIISISLVALVVYLTQIPIRRLNAFGNFLKKVLGVFPITKFMNAITKSKENKY
ncbi:hypothetical protein [Aureibaculum conchae]|uniref:hypothetical protein n=1 Tax=Aureibaculum sp. 2308TA14-22 TaxID=3108392 RepID=UPI00339A9F7A